MASLSQEEDNFVRFSLLLTGVSPRAVRTLFDHEFHPICLDAALKKEFIKLKDLQRRRILNQSQWNLLNPRIPGKYIETFSTPMELTCTQYEIIFRTVS